MSSNYPSQRVRILVPLPQGGPADILARTIAQKLTASWGQEVVVENPVGGDTITGTEMVAKAEPDGHTLLVVPSQFTVHPRQRKDLPYDVVKDFAPVILLAMSPNVLVVHPSVPANSVQELVALAKSKPGTLKYASGGPGSTSHVVAEKFKTIAGIDVEVVHYKGAAPATEAILAGETAMLFSVMAPTVAHVQSGKLRALAVTGPKRSRTLTTIPTLKEAGIPGIEVTTWQGMLAPSRTPPEVIVKINADVAKIIQLPEVQQALAAKGFELTVSTPEEFAAHIKMEVGTAM